jgi:hypothetical protein
MREYDLLEQKLEFCVAFAPNFQLGLWWFSVATPFCI